MQSHVSRNGMISNTPCLMSDPCHTLTQAPACLCAKATAKFLLAGGWAMPGTAHNSWKADRPCEQK